MIDSEERASTLFEQYKTRWWKWGRNQDAPLSTKLGRGPSVTGGSLFRAVVAREHLRAIRSEGSFSVLVFELNGPIALDQAAERMARHLRGTDVIGELGGNQVGVLLRHADATASTEVAHHLVTVLDDGHTTVTCRVFPHPPPLGRPAQREGPTKVQAQTTPAAGRSQAD